MTPEQPPQPEPETTAMIRHLPLRLWREFKAEAARRGLTAGQLMAEVLQKRYDKDDARTDE